MLFLESLPKCWRSQLESIFDSPQFSKLVQFLEMRVKNGAIICPNPSLFFQSLVLTRLDAVKVVILGQDPYHGHGQAQGLSFSVPASFPLPPSLRNIFKELESDVGTTPQHGDLRGWAEQGVLLLNSILSAEQGTPLSHQAKGWEFVTEKILRIVHAKNQNVVFIAWGGHAQKMLSFVESHKHLLLSSVHPSPLSAYRGFFGSKPFSKANQYLKNNGVDPIKW